MKFWEAMKDLEEGKKVRCLRWSSSEYIENTHMFNYSEYEWELFCEPVKTYKFTEAIQLMKGGKKIRRCMWDKKMHNVVWDLWPSIDHGLRDEWTFTLADIEASDWVVVES